MKNIIKCCLIATILTVFAVSCEKEDPIVDDNNNITIDFRDKIVGRYFCTRTSYSNHMGEVSTHSSLDTILVAKDTSANQIFVAGCKYYIGQNYYFSADASLSTQFEMFTNHGQFDTLGPITIHYVFNQSISPGGSSNITINGYKE